MDLPPKSNPIPIPKRTKCEDGECQCNNEKFHRWREQWAHDFRAKVEIDKMRRRLKRKAVADPE